MLSLFKKIDMFGTPAKLKTFGEDSFKTVFGGILTTITTVTIVIFSYLFGTDFYHRENPRVVQQDKINKKAPTYFLETARDPFMLRLTNGTLQVLDYKSLPVRIQGTYFHYKKNQGGNWETIFGVDGIAPCHQTNLINNEEILDSLVLSEWYCMDWDKITELGRKHLNDPGYQAQLTGSFDEKELTFFRLDVRNSIYDPVKKSFDVKSTYEEAGVINEKVVTIKYPSSFFDAEEREPLQINYREEAYTLSRDQRYSNRQFMKMLTVRNDLHWMLKDVEVKKSLVVDESEPSFIAADFLTKKYQDFYTKFFFMSKKEQITNRSYMKIQELAAIVGGLIKILTFNCFFITQIYAGFYLIIFYLSNLLKANYEVVKDSNSIDVTSVNNYVGDSVLQKATHSINKFKLNFFSYYFNFCCHKSKDRLDAIQAYELAEAYIKKRLDIKYLLEHFEKFESICEMVLTEDQKEALKN